jgi:GntR family transcriptional regulator of vanillate catabolism
LHAIVSEERSRGRQDGEPSPQILRALLRLREMILTGELSAASRVTELDLASRVGVSRTPLRFAMEQLAHEGLLLRRPSGGFVVRQFSVRELQDAITLRGALEATAARFAAERVTTPADRDELLTLIDAMDVVLGSPTPSMVAFEQYLDANDRFHRRLVSMAGNTFLGGLMAQVTSLPFASPSAFVHAQATSPEAVRVFTIAQEHHRGIAEAILLREGARAESLAREHARLALRFLDRVLEDRDRFVRLPGAALVRV